MHKLSEEDFIALEKRVVNGHKYLDGQWGSRDPETLELIDAWFDLVDHDIEQLRLRNMFFGYNHEGLKKSVEEKMARNTARMEALNPKKGGRRKKPIESQTLSLF